MWLYFSSDMPGGSGGRDLWRVNLRERAGSLENLGEWINTPAMKCFPMCAPIPAVLRIQRPSRLRRPRPLQSSPNTIGWLEVTNMGTL